MTMRNQKTPNEHHLEALKLFRIIFKAANKHFTEIEQQAGVGGASLWALAEIGQTASLTVSGLAKAMSIHQTTASNLLDKLEKDGFVLRTRSANDRRVVELSLTAKGYEAISKAPKPHHGVLPEALLKLSPVELTALIQNLQAVATHIDNKHEDDAYKPLGKI
jgi:DNA-binding MarR family transcriptional regulator